MVTLLLLVVSNTFKLSFPSPYLLEKTTADDITSTPTAEATDEELEEDELEAVAKHFGKDVGELTLEALIELEKKRQEGEEEDGGVPRQKGPSLETILGKMSTSSTLGLSDSISKCIGEEKENQEGQLLL